jgi:hypothetical protein
MTQMNAAGYLTACLGDLQEIVSSHLAELHPPDSLHHSLQYRILIFIHYAHLRAIVHQTSQDQPHLHSYWNHQFIEIINTIHLAFGTIQTSPYHEWPQY